MRDARPPLFRGHPIKCHSGHYKQSSGIPVLNQSQADTTHAVCVDRATCVRPPWFAPARPLGLRGGQVHQKEYLLLDCPTLPPLHP